MADTNSARARRAGPDELVVDDDAVRWTRYQGTREALIARAGIPAAAFDDANRRTTNTWRLQDGERRIEVRRTSPRRFLVYLHHPEDVLERRFVERDARRKAAEARREADREMARWPSSAAAWRSAWLREARVMLGFVEALASGEVTPGFKLDAAALDEIGVHLQAVRGLLETAAVLPDPEGRARREAELRARVVAADPTLGRFLAAVGVSGAASD